MESLTSPANPFALMIDPKAVFERIERSERLERLERHICRPLDKPLIPLGASSEELEADETASDSVDGPEADSEAGDGASS